MEELDLERQVTIRDLTVAFHSNEKLEMAVRELLRIQDPVFYRDRVFKLVPRWDKYNRISVLRDCVEK